MTPHELARAMMEAATQPQLLVDGTSRIVQHANAAFLAAFAGDPEIASAVGRPLATCGAGALAAAMAMFDEAAMAGPQGVAHVVDVTWPPLGTRKLRLGARRVPGALDDAGVAADAVLVAIDDTTDAAYFEEIVRYYRHLIASLDHAVVSFDARYVVIGWNPAAEHLLGWTHAEAMGRPVNELLTFEGGYPRDDARRLLGEGLVVRSESRVKGKGERWVDIYSGTVPLRDEQGAARSYVSVMHDISENKRLERELREHGAMLESANRDLDAFSYSVSHDLRSPLRAINGLSNVLAEDHALQLTDDAQRILTRIAANTERMGALIDDLLRFARLGRQQLQPFQVDMTALVDASFADLAPAISGRSVALTVEPLPAAIGDRALLRQVWFNLLDNAVKYTRRCEHAVIVVSAVVESDLVTYRVKDNGTGFDMRYAGKLFGVFERLHAGTEFEGTGIGLTLVDRIVRRHGGRVSAESTLGAGATFSFSLPVTHPAPHV